MAASLRAVGLTVERAALASWLHSADTIGRAPASSLIIPPAPLTSSDDPLLDPLPFPFPDYLVW